MTEDRHHIAFSMTGTGPFLFLVGAPVGISGFSALAEALGERYTVVLHDPRGIGASICDTGLMLSPELLASDLAALIRHLSNEPVLVFGASGGAVTGLELLCKDGAMVRHLVAHEPPVFGLLPDRGEMLEAADAAFALAATDPAAGMQAFVDLTEILHTTYEESPRPPRMQLPPMTAEEEARNRLFLTRMAGPTVHYPPDGERLDSDRLTVAAGEASIGQAARMASVALCDVLGSALVDAPGGHLAPSMMPTEFAAWLHRRLDDA